MMTWSGHERFTSPKIGTDCRRDDQVLADRLDVVAALGRRGRRVSTARWAFGNRPLNFRAVGMSGACRTVNTTEPAPTRTSTCTSTAAALGSSPRSPSPIVSCATASDATTVKPAATAARTSPRRGVGGAG